MSRPAPVELVVLDVVGTTIRETGQVEAAFTAALAEHGLALDAVSLAPLRGATKRDALRRLLPDTPAWRGRLEAVHATFGRQLVARLADGGVAPMPGAEEVLRHLQSRGVAVALTTGLDREITMALLTAVGWSALVETVVCGDEVASGRPAPDLIHAAMERCGVAGPDRVAAVGDTVNDLEAGHRAGVRWNVGVTSGAHDRATLARAPHTHLLDGVAELPTIWQGPGRSQRR